MIGSSRAQKKVSAGLRAKLALKQSWERIDYALDVVKPMLADIEAIEATSDVDLTEDDLVALLTTGRVPIEAGEAGESNS